jgi:hypothetical protein
VTVYTSNGSGPSILMRGTLLTDSCQSINCVFVEVECPTHLTVNIHHGQLLSTCKLPPCTCELDSRMKRADDPWPAAHSGRAVDTLINVCTLGFVLAMIVMLVLGMIGALRALI